MSLFLCWLPKCLHWPFCPGVFIAILAVVAGAVTFWEHPPRWVKAVSIFVFLMLMGGEVWMMSSDRKRNDSDQEAARATSENNFREIAHGIQVSIADSDRKFAATMGKENQSFREHYWRQFICDCHPSSLVGLSSDPFEYPQSRCADANWDNRNNPQRQNLQSRQTGIFLRNRAISVGTLHPGELRLLREKLTPIDHGLKAEDGVPADVFDLDIAAQNFTAEEHLIFKRGTRIPWVFRYQVTQQYVKSRRGDTTTFGYKVLANQKEWLG